MISRFKGFLRHHNKEGSRISTFTSHRSRGGTTMGIGEQTHVTSLFSFFSFRTQRYDRRIRSTMCRNDSVQPLRICSFQLIEREFGFRRIRFRRLARLQIRKLSKTYCFNYFPRSNSKERRHRTDFVLLRNRRKFINVESKEFDPGVRFRQLIEHRSDLFTWTTPSCECVDDYLCRMERG